MINMPLIPTFPVYSRLWKLNNSLLEKEEFTSKMSFIIKHAAEKHKDIGDKRLYWEMIKMEIRMFAIRFAKTKASADRSIELDLHQKLEEINSCIDATLENSSLVNEARKLKIQLEEIAVRKTRGAIIRSRARWYELGEKCNKYFLLGRSPSNKIGFFVGHKWQRGVYCACATNWASLGLLLHRSCICRGIGNVTKFKLSFC